MNETQTHEGGCLCGAIRYQAWVVLEKSQFAWVKGAPESISATPAVIRKFCGHCATAIQLIALVVLWYLPELATWLPKLIFGR